MLLASGGSRWMPNGVSLVIIFYIIDIRFLTNAFAYVDVGFLCDFV